MDEIVQIISTLGFPIACCIIMAYFYKYITDKDREERRELNEMHNAEMKEVTAALNNNTLALQKLCDRLDKDED